MAGFEPKLHRVPRGIALAAVVSLVTLAVNGLSSLPAAAASVPTAPSSVGATPGNASALVRWTVPASNGGSAITSYVVTPFTGTTALATRTFGFVTQAKINGLANGTAWR